MDAFTIHAGEGGQQGKGVPDPLMEAKSRPDLLGKLGVRGHGHAARRRGHLSASPAPLHRS